MGSWQGTYYVHTQYIVVHCTPVPDWGLSHSTKPGATRVVFRPPMGKETGDLKDKDKG